MRRLLVPLTCAALTTFPAHAQTGEVRPVLPAAAGGVAAPPSTGAVTVPSTATAASAAATGLTLDAAIQMALQHNPRLRAVGFELDASDGAIHQAGLIPNPSLGIDQEDTRQDTRATTVMINQTFELGGKRSARMELAQRTRDVASLDLAAQRADVRASAIQAFFDLLIAQEKAKVAEASMQLAASGSDAVTRRVTAGKVSPTEEVRARVAEATARIELRQAQSEQRAALSVLKTVMGLPAAEIASVDGRPDVLPLLPSEAELAERIQNAPALRRAQMEVERADAAFNLERARGVPDLTVGLGAKRAAELSRTQPMISLSIPIPLFDRNQGAQRQALRKRDAAQALAQAQAQRLRSEVQQAADQLQARTEEIETLRREVLPGAQTAYDAARRGFELGKFGFLDVLDAQRTLLQARGQYFAALSQAHRLSADIDRQLGVMPDRR
ncbi:outer membrane protein, cobalt-zinc-cadmium efflux system [Roseateles sp. YR242]|uniref:TolC family protein n=1 Tax=Roseateles sp. YR242 TaxID=1855305 RepID=UPI0008B8A73F|nr:TolC family protein [Roseateles sp. YR242]SEL39136.1 outer membrane protein, cobalt-zinc-cadmium efflux system [Roseateles sp. YR242]